MEDTSNQNGQWGTLICLLLVALLALLPAFIAWQFRQESACMGGACPEPAATTIQSPHPRTMRAVTPVDALSAPREGATVLHSLSIGDTVTVTESSDDWHTLTLEDQICYVPSDTLRQADQYLIVIDPGHQKKGDYQQEPVGPGATTMKPKVSSGTQGVHTGIAEYQLNLQVSMKLRNALLERGYLVEMTRTEHDVNISNAQRAEMANRLYADALIRIHANGDENPDTKGLLTLCQTPENPYNSHLYPHCRRLSNLILDGMAATTGADRKGIWETDTMSGINWCQVPVTIVEMGYLSNPEEDRLLSTEDYQNQLVQGIVNGIDVYFHRTN